MRCAAVRRGRSLPIAGTADAMLRGSLGHCSARHHRTEGIRPTHEHGRRLSRPMRYSAVRVAFLRGASLHGPRPQHRGSNVIGKDAEDCCRPTRCKGHATRPRAHGLLRSAGGAVRVRSLRRRSAVTTREPACVRFRFLEACFSNYVEGTESVIGAARDIGLRGCVAERRPGGSCLERDALVQVD